MKKAIVVGASSGMGRQLARLLVKNGYQTGITGRRHTQLAELKSENPTFYFVSVFDVTDSTAIADHLSNLAASLGGLDLLVISSGTGNINEQLDLAIEQQTIATNVGGFTAIANWGFNYFKQQRSGHLTAITSIAGLRGGRQAPAYNATKAYQINYLEALRQKAKHLNLPIVITDIRPGFVDTAMAKAENKFWEASAKKAAFQIYKAITNKAAVVYITRRWVLIAFFLKWLPRGLYRRL